MPEFDLNLLPPSVLKEEEDVRPSRSLLTPASDSTLLDPLSPPPSAGGPTPSQKRLLEEDKYTQRTEMDPQYDRRETFKSAQIRDEGIARRAEDRRLNTPAVDEFEGSTGAAAQTRRDSYLKDQEMYDGSPDQSFADEVLEDTTDAARIFTEFWAGDEMGLMGMKWDEEGFHFGKEVFMHQVTEHPYASAFTVATMMFPPLMAARKSAKLAERAYKVADAAGNVGAATGKGILERGGLGVVAQAAQNTPGVRALNLDKLGWKLDDSAELTQTLAHPDVNMIDEITGDGQYFDRNIVEALEQADSPEMIEKIVPRETLQQMITNDRYTERYFELQTLARKGELEEGSMLAAEWKMQKAFTNTYTEQIQNLTAQNLVNIGDYFKEAHVERLYDSVPNNLSDEAGEEIYKLWMEGPSVPVEEFAKVKGLGQDSAAAIHEAADRWRGLTKAQYDEGFIDPRTYDMFMQMGAEFHLPAVTKGTKDFENIGLKSLKSRPGGLGIQDVSQADALKVFGGPTSLHRGKRTTKQDVLDDLPNIETGTKKMLVGGYANDVAVLGLHRGFRDILMDNIASGGSKWDEYVTSAKNYDALPRSGRDEWVKLSGLNEVVPGLGDKVERMMQAKIKKDGLDPTAFGAAGDFAISKTLIKKFFQGEGSARAQVGNFMKLWGLQTAVYKAAKTSLNPPTHVGNFLGNMHFILQAGINPFSKTFMHDGKVGAKAFKKIAKQVQNGNKNSEELLNKENLIGILGEDRYVTNHIGQKIDMAEHYADPIVKNLFEAQAFDTVEGFGSAEEMLKGFGDAVNDKFSDKAVATAARALAGFHEIPGLKKVMNVASSLYLAEDAIPKMQMYSHLIRKGWSKRAAVKEVGRRLPQYATVGKLPKASRKIVIPWATWTTEAARITKNNMMDHPISMMGVHLQLPDIIQGTVSAAGQGPKTREERNQILAEAPEHAARWTATAIGAENAPQIANATGGAAVGFMAGTAVGGPVGGALGAAGGALLGKKIADWHGGAQDGAPAETGYRMMTNDWMTPGTLAFSSLSPHRWDKIMGDTDAPPAARMQALHDTSQVSLFAIVQPMLELAAGRDSFGNEIAATTPMEFAGKAALQLLSLQSPPAFGKYFGNIGGTTMNPITAADTFNWNGGQATIPKHMTPNYEGLSQDATAWNQPEVDETLNKNITGAALGTAVGVGNYLGLRRKGVPTPMAAAAALGTGAFTALAGREINVKRMLRDLGWKRDEWTEQYADPTVEGLANTLTGAGKSFAVGGAHAIREANFRKQDADKAIGAYKRKIVDLIDQGAWGAALGYKKPLREALIRKHDGNMAAVDEEMEEITRRMNKQLDKSKLGRTTGVDENEIKLRALRAMDSERRNVVRSQENERKAMRTDDIYRKNAGNIRLSTQPGRPGR